MSSSTNTSVTGTLFTKVSTLLTGSMAAAALGAFMGAGINSLAGIIVLAILFIGGSIGVMFAGAAAKNGSLSNPVAIGLMIAWNVVTELFLGPTLNMYVQVLGGSTVFLAFLGTAGVMAVCAAIGMFSGVNFSSLGKFLFWALLALIIVGIVNIFVAFSTGVELLYCGLGMLVFAGFFIVDFFRLKEQAGSDDSWGGAIMLTMGIFLDFVNFFLYLLRFIAAASGKSGSRR